MTQDDTVNNAPQTPQGGEQPIKNTEVAWFKQHVKIAERLQRTAKRLEQQREKGQGEQHGNS